MTSFKVATYNIHHAEGRDGVVSLPRIAEVLLRTEAEVIALQEVDRGLERSGYADQPALLEELSGMLVRFWPTVTVAQPNGALGEYGLAIATSAPVEAEFETLPRLDREEPRGLIGLPWREFGIIATHLSTVPAARETQLERLAEIVREASLPIVLLGDLNESPKRLKPLIEAGLKLPTEPPRTFPTRWPRRKIDHVLVTEPLRLDGATTLASNASDHLPLVAEVTIEDPE